jgi:hypothetical protein
MSAEIHMATAVTMKGSGIPTPKSQPESMAATAEAATCAEP